MQMLTLLADALEYPAPRRLNALRSGLREVPPDPAVKPLETFLKEVSALSLGEWEELHTRTLDLNPPAAPYIGFQVWGESYQRGLFLANMNRALWECRVDAGGELPDHLIPVLRYLVAAASPLPELVEVLQPALRRMHGTLRQADPANPYVSLFEAVCLACERGFPKGAKEAEVPAAARVATGYQLEGGKV